MLADIIDEIDLDTGTRREGVIFSARAFLFKATGSMGLVLGGVGLDLISFPSNAATGSVSSDVVWQLGLIAVPIPSLLTLLSLLLLLNYPLSRLKHQAILKALTIRNEKEIQYD